MLSTDLATFWVIYSTHGSLWRCHYLTCFSSPLCGPPLPLANHPYVITCGTGKKLSKVVGNSVSKPLKSTPNKYTKYTKYTIEEYTKYTIEWWRIAWKKLRSSMLQISMSMKIYNGMYVCIRPLLTNLVIYG